MAKNYNSAEVDRLLKIIELIRVKDDFSEKILDEWGYYGLSKEMEIGIDVYNTLDRFCKIYKTDKGYSLYSGMKIRINFEDKEAINIIIVI